MNPAARQGAALDSTSAQFKRILIDELIPHIDTTYRTIDDQPDRAMAGLSMGGMQTRVIALSHLDKFSQIGIFSGGSIAPADISDMAAFKQKIKLVFVSFGSREVDPANPRRGGPFGGDPKANTDALKEAGLNTHYYISPQTGARMAVLAEKPSRIRPAAVPRIAESLLSKTRRDPGEKISLERNQHRTFGATASKLTGCTEGRSHRLKMKHQMQHQFINFLLYKIARDGSRRGILGHCARISVRTPEGLRADRAKTAEGRGLDPRPSKGLRLCPSPPGVTRLPPGWRSSPGSGPART